MSEADVIFIQRNVKNLESGGVPVMRYSLPLVSRVTPHCAEEGAVKMASMSWSGPLNI